VVGFDISERKRAEEALRRQKYISRLVETRLTRASGR
jgi:hypothetical protein